MAGITGMEVARKIRELDAHCQLIFTTTTGEFAVDSYEVGAAKPDPAIYRAACDALGSRPRDVLFIGDSKRCDLHGPQAFGMQARWLDRKGGQTLPDCLEGIWQ